MSRWAMLALWLMVGCMEHSLVPVIPSEDPLMYQALVLEFMCTQTCEWEGVDSCWEDLSNHWAFCLDGSEQLALGQADACITLMNEAPTGECVYLPEECLVSSVTVPARSVGDSCASSKALTR